MVLKIPQWLFHFLMFPAAICPESIFSYSAYWRHAIRVSAKELLSRAFHSFLYSFLNGCILIFLLICPYFALSFPLALNTTLLLELCFMRCDSEVWLPRQSVWTGTLKLYIQPAAVGFGEDLNSLHPYTVPRIQELPSFC